LDKDSVTMTNNYCLWGTGRQRRLEIR